MTTLTLPVIETDRLTLRAPQMDDGKPFAAFLGSERAEFVGGGTGKVNYRASTRAWAHAAGLWLMRGYGPFTFCLKDGTPIGNGGAWFPATWPEPEFGWLIWDAQYEGHGYATEAMTALRDWTWSALGLTTCTAYIDPENAASQRVAKRLGGWHDTQTPDPFADDDSEPAVDVWRFSPTGTPA
jgi:RimJ/RimL family protein N-acetyltransferase